VAIFTANLVSNQSRALQNKIKDSGIPLVQGAAKVARIYNIFLNSGKYCVELYV
jgi:hypothetical protein